MEFQQNKATENLTIKVNDVVGLTEGKHGFHIHANGDCKDPGSHYNPKGVRNYDNNLYLLKIK